MVAYASDCCITDILKELIYVFLSNIYISVYKKGCSKFANKPQLPLSICFNTKTHRLGFTHGHLKPFCAWSNPSILEQKPFCRGSLSLIAMPL